MTPKWLDRTLIRNPYCMTLCTTPAQLAKLQKQLGVTFDNQIKFPKTGASANFFEPGSCAPGVAKTCVVCVAEESQTYEPIQIAALLCHEATHVVQEVMARLGEKCPSEEFVAYATQAISQDLMYEYARQKGRGT